MAPYHDHGTQQWHHLQSVMASYQMAPNGTEQWHPTTWHPAKAPYHSTQQMHRTMAPSNGTLPWHPAMTPYQMATMNGIQQWHPTTSTQQSHLTMAASNGTIPWASSNGTTSSLPRCVIAMAPYHMAPSNGILPWHPASSNGTQQWHLTMAPYHGTQQ